MIRTIAVLGAGHGGIAAAADLTRRGYRVRLVPTQNSESQEILEFFRHSEF
jgi:phytoene dehydrogenase-like protein